MSSIFTSIIDEKPEIIDAVAPAISGMDTALVKPGKLIAALTYLNKEKHFTFLKDMNAIDHGTSSEKRFSIYYILSDLEKNVSVCIKTAVHDNERVPSITDLWAGANWQERQIFDLFGIPFEGHPNLSRIIMMDGFEGHPMRKDFPITGGNGPDLIKDILLPRG
ncbi:MAG: NADH-quinone oxidoreductase subunit C [Spirochaetes bacterium]|nr:NADH-quinone oxidoreductase subunit C [Spirochaetota bacterium]